MSIPTPEQKGTTYGWPGYSDEVPGVLRQVHTPEYLPENGIDPENPPFPEASSLDSERIVHPDYDSYEYGGDR